MDTFRSTVLTGLFYERDGDLFVQDKQGPDASVSESLEPFLNQKIQIAAAHLPPTPVDPKKWGGGCCMWEPGECPAGHHHNPGYLVLMEAQGVITFEDGQWAVLTDEGKRVEVPVAMLLGHTAQVAVVTLFNSKDLSQEGSLEDIEEMGQELEEMMGTLHQLQSFLHSQGPKK